MSPKVSLREEATLEENRDEQGGVEAGRGTVAGAGGGTRVGERGGVDRCELPAGKAVVEAVSGRGGSGTAAPQRRTGVEPSQAEEVSGEGAALGAEEVRRGAGEAVWSHAGGGAFGSRRWAGGECRDAAAVDAGGRVVEPRAQEKAAPPAARAERAFWGVGAVGWKLSRLAGGARTGAVFDEPGGRRHEHDVLAVARAGNDLGSGGCVASLGRGTRSAAGAVRGLEERVSAGAHRSGAAGRGGATDAVRAHVPGAGDQDYTGELAAGQGACGEESWDATGPADQEDAAARDPHGGGSEPISSPTVSAGSQSAVSSGGGRAAGLPQKGAGPAGAGRHLPAEGRAHDQQRLGGAVRGAFSANRAREPVRARRRESDGVGGARREPEGAVPGSGGEVPRDPGTAAPAPAATGRQRPGSGSSQEVASPSQRPSLEKMETDPVRSGQSCRRRCRRLRKVQTTGLSSAPYSALFSFRIQGTFLIG